MGSLLCSVVKDVFTKAFHTVALDLCTPKRKVSFVTIKTLMNSISVCQIHYGTSQTIRCPFLMTV